MYRKVTTTSLEMRDPGELQSAAGASVEIGYSGLLPQFTGKGFGSRFLTESDVELPDTAPGPWPGAR